MGLIKLELDYTLKNAEGNLVQTLDGQGRVIGSPKSAGKVLGLALMQAIEKDPAKIVKFFDWANALGKDKPLELDVTDMATLRKFVEQSELLYVLAKGHILFTIRGAENKGS